MLLSRLLMPLWVAVIAMASLSGAVAAEWRVAKVSGDVYIQQGTVHLASLSSGISWAPGQSSSRKATVGRSLCATSRR